MGFVVLRGLLFLEVNFLAAVFLYVFPRTFFANLSTDLLVYKTFLA